jgi:hypothetical protein
MKYGFQNDLYYLLTDLNGDYDMTDEEVKALAQKLSRTRIDPVSDLHRALRIERGEEEPNYDDLDDWQSYRNKEYVVAFAGPYPCEGDKMLRRLQQKHLTAS